jgi:hypothetical protein
MMGVQKATGTINLGTTFTIEVTGLDSYVKIARGLKALRDSSLKAGLTLTGDWNAGIQYFATMLPHMNKSLSRALDVVATMYEADVFGAWTTQSLDGTWQPLNADYLADKIAKGLDRRTLIATEDALKSLGYARVNDLQIQIGVTAASDDGEPYMLVQEFGSRDGRIPARPLFKPVLDANVTRYVQVISDAVNTALKGRIYPHAGGLA